MQRGLQSEHTDTISPKQFNCGIKWWPKTESLSKKGLEGIHEGITLNLLLMGESFEVTDSNWHGR